MSGNAGFRIHFRRNDRESPLPSDEPPSDHSLQLDHPLVVFYEILRIIAESEILAVLGRETFLPQRRCSAAVRVLSERRIFPVSKNFRVVAVHSKHVLPEQPWSNGRHMIPLFGLLTLLGSLPISVGRAAQHLLPPV